MHPGGAELGFYVPSMQQFFHTPKERRTSHARLIALLCYTLSRKSQQGAAARLQPLALYSKIPTSRLHSIVRIPALGLPRKVRFD
jgi:hypothetical protein